MVNQKMEYAVKEINGDLYTPISLYQSLKGSQKVPFGKFT